MPGKHDPKRAEQRGARWSAPSSVASLLYLCLHLPLWLYILFSVSVKTWLGRLPQRVLPPLSEWAGGRRQREIERSNEAREGYVVCRFPVVLVVPPSFTTPPPPWLAQPRLLRPPPGSTAALHCRIGPVAVAVVLVIVVFSSPAPHLEIIVVVGT